ncbi:DUF1284 domain-containing protein [Martelella mediterranea]|uniref:2Fe-2S ferredoxin n=1 Tax=Martelella mediterranea DSM 17316 TaxID=1122214 RepID=A0A1U9Z3Q4_9HYPH|nr:DUF1284 domain-containing protein [Martelella mediterranea]AQZ52333.1 hypothetical protein Mame_03012 [Martelella mediterranea DSM 17316]
MTVRLRPHHLLCMLTYAGKGYSPAFTANMTVVVGRIAGGEPVEIVEGPDDICKPLLSEPDPHCYRESVQVRDRRASQDVGQLLGVSISAGELPALTEGRLDMLRQAFRDGDIRAACRDGDIRAACRDCEWQELCGRIADNAFSGTALREAGRHDIPPRDRQP